MLLPIKKIKRLLKFVFMSLLTLGLAVYLVIAMTSMTEPYKEDVCNGIVFDIEDNLKAGFVDKNTVTSLLKRAKLYPVGKNMSEINTRAIEKCLKRDEFTESVECYKSVSGKFCISVTQRTPSVYVLPDSGSGYFVDRKGKVIPGTAYKANLVVATGDIDRNYAVKSLLPLANYIQDSPFWDSQIEQICVTLNNEGLRVVELVPRVGEHVVYMGRVEDYERKLKRLKTFYEKAIGTVGWNKYETINIQYDNQIICTKYKN